MNYKPATAKEVNEARLFPAGEYDYEILKAESKMSKGNPNEGKPPRPMLAVNHKLYVGDSIRFIDRYFMLDDDRFGNLRGLCEATGLLEKYESGKLEAEDPVGKCGKLKVKITHDKFKDEDVNTISKYIIPKAKEESAGKDQVEDTDEVPF